MSVGAMDELDAVRINLMRVYGLVFGEDIEATKEMDIVEVALFIRNHLKGRHDVSSYIRQRFNVVLSQMGFVDYKLSEQFYQNCV